MNEEGRRGREQTAMLGENIRRKRMEQNISQEFLAERLAISRQSISKWENGLSEPSTKNLAQLAAVFHCEMHELLGEGAQSEEAENIPVIGVALSSRNIRKLKYFFPGDAVRCTGLLREQFCDQLREKCF